MFTRHRLWIVTLLLHLLLLLQGSVQLEELCDRSPVCAPTRARRQSAVIKPLS